MLAALFVLLDSFFHRPDHIACSSHSIHHGLQIIRILLHRLESLIFLGTKSLNLLHPFIFLCSIGISLPDEFFLAHVSISISPTFSLCTSHYLRSVRGYYLLSILSSIIISCTVSSFSLQLHPSYISRR